MRDYPETGASATADPSTAQADPDRAAAFLESLAGGLPVTVAAIPPEGGGPRGATFTLPGDRDGLRAWIAGHEGADNLYYSLNAASGDRPRAGKAGRLREEDVTHIRGVAVDLDPAKGVPLEEERSRLFGVAQRADANPFGSPTAVVDSGGGVQMLWLFPAPLPCTSENAGAVKAQARGLGKAFGSDAVQSLDHLFRLPFTRNLPDAAKRARGRTVSVASVWARSDERHDLPSLRFFAPPTEAKESGAAAALSIEYPDILDALGAPERLPAELRAVAEDCVARRDEIVGDAGDRSTIDYRLAAHLVRKHRITGPTELASVVFAVSPEKLTDREAQGSGENYCAQTIAKVLARNHPDPNPLDFFEPVTDEDLAAAAELQAMFGPQEASRKPRIEVLKRSDIRQLPDPEFVINRHIPEASMGFLYGAPGSGKSFIAIDWAMHMAAGMSDWHGDRIAVKPSGWVVYLAREGASGMGLRLEAWERRHTPFAESDARFAQIPSAIDFMKPEDIGATVEAVRTAGVHPVSMIVVDTVSRSMPGADENLQKDMTTFVAACDRLKDEFGCVVLGVHHASKSGDMRGSSVLLGAGDFVFRVSKHGEADGAACTRRLTLTCEKMKDAPDGWSEDYRLEAVALGRRNADGEEVASLVPRRAPKVERNEVEARAAAAWAGIILEALGDRDSAPWAEMWSAVGDAARAQGLIKATSEQKVRAEASAHLGRMGADATAANGQIVNVRMEQAAAGKPWHVRRFVLPDLDANAGEPEGSK